MLFGVLQDLHAHPVISFKAASLEENIIVILQDEKALFSFAFVTS